MESGWPGVAGAAWIAYLPIPGLAWVAAALRPRDRLTRFHAWQGGLLVAGLYVYLILLGILLKSLSGGGRRAVADLGGIVLAALVVMLVLGIVAAARGRFTRLRPFWDLARAIHPKGM